MQGSSDQCALGGAVGRSQAAGAAVLVGGCRDEHSQRGAFPERPLLEHCHCAALPAAIAVA